MVDARTVSPVLPHLATGFERSLAVADAICAIVIDGAELGALEPRAVRGPDGVVREAKVPPNEWFARLARAAEVGAFERHAPAAIVDRIISTEAPQ